MMSLIFNRFAWMLLVALLLASSLIEGAPIGSKTYIIHTVRNATHVGDSVAKHAWYSELVKGAGGLLEGDHRDDGTDSLHHVYHHVLNGFSARLTPEQAAYMRTLPDVVAVHPDRFHFAHTTHTPEFLGLPTSKIWPESKYGGDAIIGVIDSGIWPERLSFSDHGLGPIPARWKGQCQTGTNFTAANCNNKIIGARYISKGFESEYGAINDTVTDYKSARDVFSGHGTHVTATAAGRWAYRASSSSGVVKGTARGMAPKARIAVYKVLWRTAEGRVTGSDSDIVHAFDQAVADGVDVISISIGPNVDKEWGLVDLFEDPIAIAAYHATKRGVFVAVSGGNNGEIGSGSIANVSPWMTTVAATTTDRELVGSVVVGNGSIFHGRSTYNGKALSEIPLIFGGDAAINSSDSESASFCEVGTLNASLVIGKILMCNFDKNIVHQMSFGEATGTAALILANTDVLGEELFTINGDLPSPVILLGNQAREGMMTYIKQASAPVATLRGASSVHNVVAPRVAGFSSRGPINILTRPEKQWLKPDLAAPGVDILAAGVGDERYRIMSGTSMACPHISGIAALIRSAHPKWSPAAIKSAMMTTATTLNNRKRTITKQESGATAGPWEFGAGFVQPDKAMNPGLVYDMGADDYLMFLCGLGYDQRTIRKFDHKFLCPSHPRARIEDTNLPSFVARFDNRNSTLSSSGMTFNRTLTNVARVGSTYTASVDSERLQHFQVVIEPSILTFAGEASIEKFTLTVAPRSGADFTALAHGHHIQETAVLSWSDGVHVVQSPIVAMFYA